MKFQTILADPPWLYEHSRTKSRSIEAHYNTMTIDDICNMEVSSVASPGCILLLWCTWPKLEEGIRVVSSWGFRYVSGFPWLKMTQAAAPRLGMGYYTRSVSELVLIGVKEGGSGICPAPADRLPGVIFCPVGKHSRKPDYQYDFAEKFKGPYLELFARGEGLFDRNGWTRIGNDITGRDINDDLFLLKERQE